MTKNWLPLGFAVALLAAPATAQAPSAADRARVVEASGEVSVKGADGAMAPVAAGAEVVRGQELHTGIDSEAKLQFADGSVMAVKEMTQVLVADLLGEGSRQTIKVALKVGEMEAQVNPQKTFKSDFKVTTPTATASVRGTKIRRLSYDVTRGTRMELGSGSLLMTKTDGPSIDNEGGDTTQVDPDGDLVTPREYVAAGSRVNVYPNGIVETEVEAIEVTNQPQVNVPGAETEAVNSTLDEGGIFLFRFERSEP